MLFSISAILGRHRQLDDSLVGQLTSISPIDCDITIQGTDTTRIQLVAVGAPMHLMLSHFDTKTPIDEQGAFLLRIHYGSDQTHWTFLKTSFQDDRRLF